MYSAFHSMARHVLIPTLTLTFLLFASGCSDDGPTGSNAPTGPLSFETIEQSSVESSAVNDDAVGDFQDSMQRVIGDQSTFESFWYDLHGENAEVPSVNFSQKMVVVAVLGERQTDGYEAEIASITRNTNPSLLSVFVTEIEPGSNCSATESNTLPYHVVKLDRVSTDEVSFQDNGTETKDCG